MSIEKRNYYQIILSRDNQKKQEKAKTWKTAIGLQDIDRLRTDYYK